MFILLKLLKNQKNIKQNGYISLSFYLSEVELGSKIYLMLKEAFNGREPLVVSQNSGNDQEFRSQPYAFIIGNSIDKNFDISNSGLTKVSFFQIKII